MQSLTLDTVAPDATPFCGTHHRWPDDIAGYVVVLTRFGEGKVADFRVYGASDYGVAVEDAHTLRLGPAAVQRYWGRAGFAPTVDYDYARIDVVYVDGCRRII